MMPSSYDEPVCLAGDGGGGGGATVQSSELIKTMRPQRFPTLFMPWVVFPLFGSLEAFAT